MEAEMLKPQAARLMRSGSSAAAASRAAASCRFSSEAMRTALSAADGGYCGCAGAGAGSAQGS